MFISALLHSGHRGRPHQHEPIPAATEAYGFLDVSVGRRCGVGIDRIMPEPRWYIRRAAIP
jgi:hypothetical protein